jgi:hypothetical protein
MVTLTMLHVNNDENCVPRSQPGYDPLHMIRSILSKQTKKFHKVYTPEEILTVDEF